MIRELYQRLSLRYQIYEIGKKIQEINLERASVRFPNPFPLSTLSAAAAMASFDYLGSLKIEEAGLLTRKRTLETRLTALVSN